MCVAAAQCCFSNHSLLPVAFVDNCCKLLRAPIIIFFQAQPEFMMAKRGEWPMGCEIARRRFLLTSATGAATVSQPQCRDALRWAGLEFKRKWNSKKKKITSGLEHKAVSQRSDWTLHWWVFSVKRWFSCYESKHTPEPNAPSPLSPLRSRGVLWDVTVSLSWLSVWYYFIFYNCSICLVCKWACLQVNLYIHFITTAGRMCIYSWLMLI